jgi:transposase
MKPPEFVSATQAQLDELLALARAASFPQPQYDLLAGILGTFLYVMCALQNAKTSLKRFRHLLFGKRTESTANLLKAIGSGPGGASDQAAGSAIEPALADSAALSAGAGKEPKKCKGHGRNGADAYRNATVVEIELPDLHAGDICPGCTTGKVYDAPPRTIVKVVGQAPLTAVVYKLARQRCRLCDAMFTAPLPDGVSPSKYDHSCASMVALLRYGSGVPHHRLDKLQASMHIPLPDSTQWDIVEKAAAMGPRHAFEEMIRQAAQGEVLHNDDTPARILALMGERRAKAVAAGKAMPSTKAINTSGIVSLLGPTKVVLFLTGPAHAGTNLARVLAHRAEELRAPIQMCDALAANVKGDFTTFLSLCLAHSRRQFVEVASSFPDPCRHVIEVLAKIYQHDAHAKDEKMSDLQRLLYHRTNSRPLMQELKGWMEKQFDERQVEPNSGLGQAMRYMLKHWKGLTLFLRKAGAPVDNNIAERALKKAIIHRKNSLFYRSVRGAEVGDIFMSLIYTCESCKANPFEYLQALQKHAGDVADKPHLWLPWNYEQALAHP